MEKRKNMQQPVVVKKNNSADKKELDIPPKKNSQSIKKVDSTSA